MNNDCKKIKRSFSQQLGRSTLEMICVLAVFGVIVGGMMGLAGKVFSGRNDATVIAEILYISNAAKNLLKWYPEITGTDDHTVLKYLVCQGYMRSNKQVTTCDDMKEPLESDIWGLLPNGRTVDVQTERINLAGEDDCAPGKTGCQNVVTLVISGLTQSECIALVTADWGVDLFGLGTKEIGNMEYLANTGLQFPIRGGEDISYFCGPDKATNGNYDFFITMF